MIATTSQRTRLHDALALGVMVDVVPVVVQRQQLQTVGFGSVVAVVQRHHTN